MDVGQMVRDYLSAKGYGGLYNEIGDCGCQLSDLFPCSGIDESCRPGYKVNCTADCDHWAQNEGDWHIQEQKPGRRQASPMVKQ